MLFVFDWDGTISDSAAKIVRCMQVAAERAGVAPQSRKAIANIIGLGMPEALQVLYPQLSEVLKEKVRQEYADYFRQEDQTPSPFFDGALDTMTYLRDQGFLISVATGKSRRGLDRVLKKLGMEDFFHATRCADETASKPDPMMLAELLDALNVDVSDAVMVGDTEYDMAMAASIGMQKIAVSYGAHHPDRLKKYSPDLLAHKFPDIKAWRF